MVRVISTAGLSAEASLQSEGADGFSFEALRAEERRRARRALRDEQRAPRRRGKRKEGAPITTVQQPPVVLLDGPNLLEES